MTVEITVTNRGRKELDLNNRGRESYIKGFIVHVGELITRDGETKEASQSAQAEEERRSNTLPVEGVLKAHISAVRE